MISKIINNITSFIFAGSFSFITLLYKALTLCSFWKWFIVPLGLPLIPFQCMVGIIYFYNLLKYDGKHVIIHDNIKDAIIYSYKANVDVIIYTSVVYYFGYLIYNFFIV